MCPMVQEGSRVLSLRKSPSFAPPNGEAERSELELHMLRLKGPCRESPALQALQSCASLSVSIWKPAIRLMK